MLSKTSEFKVTDQGTVEEVSQVPKTEQSELEQLQAKWYAALEEGWQSKLLKVFRLRQDGRERLFYVLTQEAAVDSLKTTVRARCMRDDLQVVDVQITYTNVPNLGIKQESSFKLIPDPKKVGVDPQATMLLVDRIISGRTL